MIRFKVESELEVAAVASGEVVPHN